MAYYPPGTVLSYFSQQRTMRCSLETHCFTDPTEVLPEPVFNTCTVLTEGNVMVTFVKGTAQRTIMPLISWLHLAYVAGGKEPDIIVTIPAPEYMDVYVSRVMEARSRVLKRQAESRDVGATTMRGEFEYAVGSFLEYGLPGATTACTVLPGYMALVTANTGIPCYETMSLADFLVVYNIQQDPRFPGQKYTMCGSIRRCGKECPFISYTNSLLPAPIKETLVPVAAASPSAEDAENFVKVPAWVYKAVMKNMPEYKDALVA